jgi:LysR family transcriptional activator of mexEF-oprN operon
MNNRELLPKLVKIDLNLLTTLYALLEEGSTQKAADRLGRTQSAASHALGRLRDLFDDPLFIRHGPKLSPTPFALSLYQPLLRILHDASSLIETGIKFDPKTTERQSVLSAPDNCVSYLSRIADRLLADAPGLRIRFENARDGKTRLMNGETDLLLSLYGTNFPGALDASHVENCEWTVLARKGHPIPNIPTAHDWARFGHVQVGTGPAGRNPIADAAKLVGVDRTVRIKVATFLEAMHMAAGSDLLFTTLGKIVADQSTLLGLRSVVLPFDVPSVPLSLVVRQPLHDPLSAWLKRHALSVLRQ